MKRLSVCAFFLVPALAFTACTRPRPTPRSDPSATPPASASAALGSPITLRILFTSDEHGWVAPAVEKGRARGGAPALLARWRAHEGHCVPSQEKSCEEAATLALSGGDNWTGPALSSFFKGEVAAESMRRLGYAASALGNHELDFGRAGFDRNAALEAFPYVGANVSPPLEEGGITRPFVLVKRSGVTVGVVGLAFKSTPKVGLRENYKGLAFSDEEDALASAVPAAWAAGADAVVVIAHVCAETLKPIVARHPEWRLAFVGGGHCHKKSHAEIGGTPVVEAGAFLHEYIRATLSIDLARPQRERVVSVHTHVVDLTYPENAPPALAPDADEAALVATWQEKTNAALGRVIGYTGETLDPDTPPLANFITDRWREATSADVAMLNRFATRQAIAKGPITLETIYSVLPFDNRLVTMKLTGADLIADVKCCQAHVSGVRADAKGEIVLASGKPIDPAHVYKVVSTDYAYWGGSDFPFEKQDPGGVIGEDWRAPLLRWLEEHPTREGTPLDAKLDHAARLPRPKVERH